MMTIIWTPDLWCSKPPLYQLSQNPCSTFLTNSAKQKICREQYLSYKVTLKSMRPASIQVPCPTHGIEPVERLGIDIGKINYFPSLGFEPRVASSDVALVAYLCLHDETYTPGTFLNYIFTKNTWLNAWQCLTYLPMYEIFVFLCLTTTLMTMMMQRLKADLIWDESLLWRMYVGTTPGRVSDVAKTTDSDCHGYRYRYLQDTCNGW